MIIHCKSATRAALAVAALVGLLVLAGCGNKGPLVHPAHTPASSASTPAAGDSADD